MWFGNGIHARRIAPSGEAPPRPIGFPDALAALNATDAQALRTAFVQHEHWPWLFVLLVEPTGRALACIGINHPPAPS